MGLLEYIRKRWYAFGIILFVIGAGFFIASENKKQEKYENCNCGEVMYSKTDYDLHLQDDYVTFKCTFCKKEHEHGITKKREYLHPTCTVEGYEKYTYTCNEVSWFTYEDFTNLGFAEHQYFVHNLGTKPTCTSGGISDFEICNVCYASKGGEEVGPLGHSLITIDAISPTCTEVGYTVKVVCENCDHVESLGEEIKPLGHHYTTSVVEPTYSTDGYTNHACTRCDDSLKENYVDCLFANYCNYGINEGREIYLYGLKNDVEELIIPETINGYPVVRIYNYFSCGVFDKKENTTLKKVVMPNTITYIGESAFYKCRNLEEVTFSDNIGCIDQNAFYECLKLKTIKLSNKLNYLGESAFYGCESLTRINIPSQLTFVDSNVFGNCKGLQEIIINRKTTVIQGGALSGCKALKIVYFFGSSKEWSNISIDISSKQSIYLATVYYYSEKEPVEEGNYWHYDTDGVTPIIWNNQKGG